VGNARTALFNWLFARQKAGTMVLRIEDTDVERSEERFEGQLLEDLRWLGLDWDEGPDVGGAHGPYRQSDRLELYRSHAERLLEQAKAYLCFCTAEELERERERAVAERRNATYSGKCRQIDQAEARRRRAAGEAAAIRLSIPEHPIRFHDIVHGAVEFASEVVSDPIILRSSGMPVYNYVVVIDDAEMKITHVIRGDDHLSNTPKQVALYEALGWPVPQFAHLSTILGSDRERLSKRHGATSIANFRAMGVLPEALMNYLALLGWAPSGGTREIFSKAELMAEFSLERVTPSPAVFDMEKLYWLNRHYIKQRLSLAVADSMDGSLRASAKVQLENAALPFFVKAGLVPPQPDENTKDWLWKVTELFAPAVDRMEQLPERASIIFEYDPNVAVADPENAALLETASSRNVIEAFVRKVLQDSEAKAGRLSPEGFQAIANEVKSETGVKGKELFHPIRIVVIGTHSGPAFDKLIPLIEEGSHLPLRKRVLSVRERAEQFERVFAADARG
jgi:glutamyl-tRNA synthetase/nondiscriminating glutamyl-tRNA synthetase